jgi:hypothetical protein
MPGSGGVVRKPVKSWGKTLNFDVLDPLGIFSGLNGRDNFREMDLDWGGACGGGIDVNFFGDAIEIARLGVPVLAFAFVHGELDGVAVSAVESSVFVEDALDPVVAGGKIAKIGRGVAESVIGDDGVLARSEGVDVDSENLLGVHFYFEDLGARLGVVFGGDDDVDAAVERSGAEFRIERDGEARLRDGFCGWSLRRSLENCGGRSERDERQEVSQRAEEKLACGFARDAAIIL